MVKFATVINIHVISKDKEYNYLSGRREREKLNRRLNKIERYMRIHHLISKGEYLNFGFGKHIRIPFIEQICHDRGWLLPCEHLTISF